MERTAADGAERQWERHLLQLLAAVEHIVFESSNGLRNGDLGYCCTLESA